MGMPCVAAGARRRRRRLGRAPRGDPRAGRAHGRSGCAAARCSSRPSEPMDAATLDDAVAALRRPFDSVHGGWGGAPKFPAASVIEFLLRRGEHADGAPHAALDGLGRHQRPGRRRLRALHRRRHLDRPALREDALRQRAARARVPARLAGQRRPAAAAHRRGDARVGAARDARARGRLLLSALDADSEGVEGKFYVWTLDELRGGPRRRRADAAIAWFGATRRGNFEGANVLESRGAEPPPERARADPRARCSRRASERVRPGLDDKRLTVVERAHDRARWPTPARSLGRDDLLDAARDAARFVLERMRDADGRLLRTFNDGAGAAERLPRGPRLPARGAAHALRGDVRGALVHRGARRSPTRSSSASPTPSAAASSRPPPTTSSSSRGARTSRTRRSRPAARAPRFGLLRLAALTGEAALRGARARRTCACCTRSRRSTRRRSATCCRRSTSTSPPTREVALVGDPTASPRSPRVVRERAAPAPRARGRRRAATAPCRCMEGRGRVDGRAAAYVCERFACLRPVTGADELRALLETHSAGASIRSPIPRVAPAMSRLLAFPAHPRHKWIVFGVWLARHRRRARRQPARQVRRRREERVVLVPARRRRVDAGAGRTEELAGRRAGADGRRLPPRRRADRGRPRADRRRPRRAQRAALPRHDAVRAADVSRSDGAARAADRATSPATASPTRSSTRSRTARERVSDPGGGLEVEGHRRRRLQRRRDQGLREHQRHAAAVGGARSSSSCWRSSTAARSSCGSRSPR